MRLIELISELRDNMLRDGSTLVSGDADALWNDETLARYINNAYYRFCRLTLSLSDNSLTTATTVSVGPPAVLSYVNKIVLATDVDQYPLHESILAVISGRLAGAPVDLARTGHGVLDLPFRSDDSLYFDINVLAALPPGKPLACATDEADRVFRVYPTPSADYNTQVVNLRTIRLPLEKLSLDVQTGEPEIREEWQLGMLNWAAYLALSNRDVDGGDPEAATRFKTAFAELVDEVKQEARRRRFAGTAWNFGRDGFSWVK